jgi:co-chaperonin GroES (HSP10)
MTNNSPIVPVSDRVLLEWFLEDFNEKVGGIIIPENARESVKKPKYRWVKIIGVGKGCLEVKVGQEALLHEAQVEQVVIPKDTGICYIRENQIIAVRDPAT